MTDVFVKQEPSSDKKVPKKTCRYFKQGFCGFGKDKCSYRHPKQENGNTDRECRFYKKASCRFAFKCRNKHILPEGKEYPKPDPLNTFIVVGPSKEEPEKTEEPPVKDSAHSPTIPTPETETLRKFERPKNQKKVFKNCFFYEEKGKCYYGDRCWYSHGEPLAHPADELLLEVNPESELELEPEQDLDNNKMCYDFIFTECEFGDECPYVHGKICEYCDLPFLHPSDEQQQNEHLEACLAFTIEDMEKAIRITLSKDKMCEICLDKVWGENNLYTAQKFGIHKKCNHVFCLGCIRRWRYERRKESLIPNCSSCREVSGIVPSASWFKDEDEKIKWFEDLEAARADQIKKKRERENSEVPPNSTETEYGDWRDVPQDFGLRSSEQRGGGTRNVDEPNNPLPSGKQEGHNNMATEVSTIEREQQDTECSNVQGQESLDDTPQMSEDLDLQQGEQATPSNLADESQIAGSSGQVNIVDDGSEQIPQDSDISDDTQED